MPCASAWCRRRLLGSAVRMCERDMNTSEEYFTKKLYPFQDGILSIVKKSGTPFYLTGGTALSRRWFAHRYSEDLDLFVDADPRYSAHVDALFMSLKDAEKEGALVVDDERLRRSRWHTQLWVSRTVEGETIDLKVDLVNDTAPHVGDVEVDPVLGRADNWRNILSNKIAAVFRYEPKDVADIWIISRNRSFSWREIVSEALCKEGGVDPVALHDILRSVPERELARVAWSSPVDLKALLSDLAVIADDILFGRQNSLLTSAGASRGGCPSG